MKIWDYENLRAEYKNNFTYNGKKYVFSGVVAKDDEVISIYGRCRQDKTEIEIPAERFTEMVNW